MSDEFKKNALSFLQKAKENISSATEKTLAELEKSGTLDELKKRQAEFNAFLKEKGLSEKAQQGMNKAKEFSDLANEQFDQMSGKTQLDRLEQKIEQLQVQLDEALVRVKVLEKAVGKDSK